MFEISDLLKWMAQFGTEKKAYDGFWLNFDNYKVEEPEEFEEFFGSFELNQLEVKIDTVSINYSNNYPEFDYNHVIITIPIKYRGKRIGYYKLLLNFDGVIDDDFFVLQ